MRLSLVRHLWGVDLSRGYTPHLAHWRALGYDTLESSPRLVPDARELRRVLSGEGLRWIPQVFSNMFLGGASTAVHLSSLREQIEECLDAAPLFLNAHSGSDSWTLDQAEDFYHGVAELEAEFGCRVAHETHRSRFFGNPWQTGRLLQRVPGVMLTCDFSHWVCVAERLLEDAEDIIEQAADHALHLHCRVGYEQGPQVSDPRAPEWSRHLAVHERWWRAVWRSQSKRRISDVTLTPEFGPAPYLPLLPYSREPVANLEDICDWMAERQRVEFGAWSQAEETVAGARMAGAR